ncbi:MAG: queuosine precursor transporter [Fimbriimonadales bacterium]
MRLSTEQGYSIWFLLVVALMLTSLLVSNIVASKVVQMGPFIISGAEFIFPISYIVNDVLTEVYGYRRSRLVIWIGFGANLLMVLAIQAAIALPPAPFWESQEAFATVLGATPRLLVASLCAYLVGEFMNSYVLAKMKILTKGRWLWTRTIGSTFVGQMFDTAIFSVIAFWGIVPLRELVIMMLTVWSFKTLYEALVTPLTYGVVNFLKRREGVDVYDYDTRFNPFVLE